MKYYIIRYYDDIPKGVFYFMSEDRFTNNLNRAKFFATREDAQTTIITNVYDINMGLMVMDEDEVAIIEAMES